MIIDLFSKIFSSKIFYLVFSLLVAFSLWLYVEISNTHVYDVTIDAPVQIIGEDILLDRDLFISSYTPEFVTLAFDTSRSAATALRRGSLAVAVDVSRITSSGPISVEHEIIYPENFDQSQIERVSRSTNRITLNIDRLTSKQISVEAPYTGGTASEYLVIDPIIIDPPIITVFGPEDVLSQISVAYVEILRENPNTHQYEIKNKIVTSVRNWCCGCNKYKKSKSICTDCGSEIEQHVNDIDDYMNETPTEVRQGAIDRCIEAYQGCLTKIRKRQIRKFYVKFKSKKELTSDSIKIPKKASKIYQTHFECYTKYKLGEIKYTKRTSKKMKSKTKRQLKGIKINPKHDLLINYNFKSKEWFLLVPIDPNLKQPKNKINTIISCDPGVKHHQTCYNSSDGSMMKFNNRMECLNKLRRKIDLQQEHNKSVRKSYRRFNNIITDSHWRWCDMLVKTNPDVIIIPKFESQKLKNKSKFYNFKLINICKHYQFREMLSWMCLKNGIHFKLCTEEYTTQTCTRCGALNKLELKDRIYNCSECSYGNVDRDYHGARNILIKCLQGGAFFP